MERLQRLIMYYSPTPYNYYNTLAWFYKFSKSFDSSFKFSLNNSDLVLSVRLRRSWTSYMPYTPTTFSPIFNAHQNSLYIYVLLQPMRRFKKSNFSKFSLFDFRMFSSSTSFYSLYKNFRFVFSTEFTSIMPEKLFFIGSYDPIKNNFYDFSFMSFFSQVSPFCTPLTFLSFFQNSFLTILFGSFFSFFIHIFIFC
jgi:hypothetical protein